MRLASCFDSMSASTKAGELYGEKMFVSMAGTHIDYAVVCICCPVSRTSEHGNRVAFGSRTFSVGF